MRTSFSCAIQGVTYIRIYVRRDEWQALAGVSRDRDRGPTAPRVRGNRAFPARVSARGSQRWNVLPPAEPGVFGERKVACHTLGELFQPCAMAGAQPARHSAGLAPLRSAQS